MDQKTMLLTQIRNHRIQLTPAERKASRESLKRLSIQSYPFLEEGKLKSRLSQIVKPFIRGSSTVKEKYPASKYDSYLSDMLSLFSSLTLDIDSAVDDSSLSLAITAAAERIAESILLYNQDLLAEELKELTGSAFYGTAEWWDDMKTEWMASLEERVRNLILSYPSTVRDTVLSLVRENADYDTILAAIAHIDASFSEAKISFIARDLTGKINGEIQRGLQLDLGIDTYLWQTRGDERVRGKPGGMYPRAFPSHWAIDFKLCSWKDPTIVSYDYGKTWVPRAANMPMGIPGSDWACRCSSLPYSVSLAAFVDKELQNRRRVA